MSQSSLTHHDLDPETLRLNLPENPGVYLFRDASEKVVYIGKAKNLRKRVLSYFKSSGELTHKTQLMMRRAYYGVYEMGLVDYLGTRMKR